MMQEKDIWDEIDPIIESLVAYIKSYMKTPKDSHPSRKDFFRLDKSVATYSVIYNMITDKKSDHRMIEELYHREMKCIASFCGGLEYESIEMLNRQHDGFRLFIAWIGCFLHHLNLFYLRLIGSSDTMETIYLSYFCNEFIYQNLDAITNDLVVIWNADRKKSIGNQDGVYLIKCFETIHPNFYDTWESTYLEECERYYATMNDVISSHDEILTILEREKELCHKYMSKGRTWKLVLSLYKKMIVAPHFTRILNDPESGWKSALRRNDILSLAQMLDLCNEKQSEWLECYASYIKEELREERKIMKLYEFLSEQAIMLQDAGIYRDFEKILHEELRAVIDTQMMSRLVRAFDFYIKKKDVAWIKKIMRLFCICGDTETFMNIYKEMLKQRILDVDADLEMERLTLGLMRERMGASYVMTALNMIHNVKDQFLCSRNVRLTILSKIMWDDEIPIYPSLIQPPSLIHDQLQNLTEIYRESIPSYRDIKLVPSYDHGCVILHAWFSPSDHGMELIMSPIQAIALLGIHEGSLEIQNHVRKNVYDSLCREKTSILIPQENERWIINTSFVSRSRRVRMPPVPAYHQEKVNDVGHCMEEVDKIAPLDAFIVRTLKHHHPDPIEHGELVKQCGMLSQHPPIALIKQRIESLMEREYIARHGLSAYQYS